MSPRPNSPAALQRTAPIFAALGDPTRLYVLSRLSSEGPLSITQLSVGADVTRQAVTKHLNVLATAGLVHDFRQGREHVWQLKPAPFAQARRTLDAISEQWDAALERLKAMVEG